MFLFLTKWEDAEGNIDNIFFEVTDKTNNDLIVNLLKHPMHLCVFFWRLKPQPLNRVLVALNPLKNKKKIIWKKIGKKNLNMNSYYLISFHEIFRTACPATLYSQTLR